ncbi:hypothetical protein A5634_21585 [Mycobacterium asiaticum]|uniref:Uncharacterized protein n=1 Tax=Mycobacterium asiaticum TaxID=1790 RepID=A0A1A3P2N8_MYCAS|nr:hypothetical protein A5634_21585 [Mycobacterium asiaticum]
MAATAAFYQVNGYVIAYDLDPGRVVELVVYVAEGLVDVPNIAATLKGWAKTFPPPAEWIDDDHDNTGGRHHRGD